jgi:nitrile hydratase accessory protein
VSGGDRWLRGDGPGAPPRRNGELVFEQPWEGRLFGLTVALHERGAFAWDEFRAELIAAIARWERESPAGAGYRYWERWLEAFERLLAARGLCARAALDARARELAARPAGHDHGGPEASGDRSG